MTEPRVRVTLGEVGHHSKVELRIKDGEWSEWIDISHIVTRVDISTKVGELTVASIDVIRVETAEGSHPIFLDRASLKKLAQLVDDARADGIIGAPGEA